jgi:hypothetical protein
MRSGPECESVVAALGALRVLVWKRLNRKERAAPVRHALLLFNAAERLPPIGQAERHRVVLDGDVAGGDGVEGTAQRYT